MPSRKPRKPVPAFDAVAAKKLLDALVAGCHLSTAAEFAGVLPAHARQWLSLGRRRRTGPLHDFAVAVGQTRAKAEVRAASTLQKHFGDDWRPAERFLKMRHGRRWDPATQRKALKLLTLKQADARAESQKRQEQRRQQKRDAQEQLDLDRLARIALLLADSGALHGLTAENAPKQIESVAQRSGA